MKTSITIISALLLLSACTSRVPYGGTVTMDDATLMDKIKGGWYGQTIGCTYGGPTEFKYKGGIIMEEIPIPWYDDYIYDTYIEDPGLYDDVYMDLTFMETMMRFGMDATRRRATTSSTGAAHRKAATGSTILTQTTSISRSRRISSACSIPGR